MSKKKPAKKVEIGATPSQDVTTVTPAVIQEAKVLVITEAFKHHDSKMKPEQVQFAQELGEKFPDIVLAVTNLRESLTELQRNMLFAGQRYFETVKSVRASGMNKRESTLLLKGLGFDKFVISRILKIASVTPDIWAKYESKELGFNATLLLARGTDKDTEEATPASTPAPTGEDGSTGPDGSDDRSNPRNEPTPFPKKLQKIVQDALIALGEADLRAPKDGSDYEFTYQTAKGREYTLTLTIA